MRFLLIDKEYINNDRVCFTYRFRDSELKSIYLEVFYTISNWSFRYFMHKQENNNNEALELYNQIEEDMNEELSEYLIDEE